jgi:cell fate regulator YaaT (PSP1 superfamily)
MSNENEQENKQPDVKSPQAATPCGNGCAGNGCSGNCSNCSRHCGPRGKLHCYNWLEDIPGGYADDDMVEVQFKNTRKGYYKNSTNLPLSIGDMVAVEASPGHDIGQVTLTGALVRLQMRKANIKPNAEVRRVFRIAKPADLEKYEEARARENDTMIRARKIAEDLKLNMKIGDVEYQGDGNKAIFYYIADERVDFRQLIKVLADAFKVRIEMKQIGARQEAGRIGGIGPCGRPLCCASWMTNFVSVATSAARYQDISLNPQKLAGQCAKLKCCLNFEVDAYVEMSKKLPPKTVRLETADATYYHFKTDIFKREITYSTDKAIAANLVTLDPERVFEIIDMNKKGEKPLTLQRDGNEPANPKDAYTDLLDQDELTRFDSKRRKKKKKKGGAKPTGDEAQAQQKQQQPSRNRDKQPRGPKPAKEGKDGNKGNQANQGNQNNNE